jgi:hypothetical protein
MNVTLEPQIENRKSSIKKGRLQSCKRPFFIELQIIICYLLLQFEAYRNSVRDPYRYPALFTRFPFGQC